MSSRHRFFSDLTLYCTFHAKCTIIMTPFLATPTSDMRSCSLTKFYPRLELDMTRIALVPTCTWSHERLQFWAIFVIINREAKSDISLRHCPNFSLLSSFFFLLFCQVVYHHASPWPRLPLPCRPSTFKRPRLIDPIFDHLLLNLHRG